MLFFQLVDFPYLGSNPTNPEEINRLLIDLVMKQSGPNVDPIWPCGNDPGNNPPMEPSLGGVLIGRRMVQRFGCWNRQKGKLLIFKVFWLNQDSLLSLYFYINYIIWPILMVRNTVLTLSFNKLLFIRVEYIEQIYPSKYPKLLFHICIPTTWEVL